jgi:hypothetical protein
LLEVSQGLSGEAARALSWAGAPRICDNFLIYKAMTH